MNLSGRSIIGHRRGADRQETLQGVDAQTGQSLEPLYHSASAEEVDLAVELARQAFAVYGSASGKQKGEFLRCIADRLDARVDDLVERAGRETGLPAARIRGETARATGQLRLFAALAEEGSWVDARIDRADPQRSPIPKPDVRSLLRPLGPTAVFCAANFPIAFSVAGGDTASALAAGNPVVVNAHYAHPATAEIAGLAIQEATQQCSLPEGVFSLLYGADLRVGQQLVDHPGIRAVGFTGSRRGGKALMERAARRPEPIPVFAEMSSVNPVFLLPGAMRQRGSKIAEGLHASVNLGVGQFCTNPGLVIVEMGPESEEMTNLLRERMNSTPSAVMLHQGIRRAYGEGVQKLRQNARLEVLAQGASEGNGVGAALFSTDARSFLGDPELGEEIFGPSTVLVQCSNPQQMLEVAEGLEGQLTASLHGTEEDLRDHRDLVQLLVRKAGRLIFNGFPTGVEVCPAMVHGGPYPATSDGRSTSVGTRAVLRFCRPVCYQDFPSAALPPELQDHNPLGIWRLLDGRLRRDAVQPEG